MSFWKRLFGLEEQNPVSVTITKTDKTPYKRQPRRPYTDAQRAAYERFPLGSGNTYRCVVVKFNIGDAKIGTYIVPSQLLVRNKEPVIWFDDCAGYRLGNVSHETIMKHLEESGLPYSEYWWQSFPA